MCGSQPRMISPSISSTRRSTPCAAGCCGPKFIVRFWISGKAAPLTREPRILADHAWHVVARLDRDRLVDHAAGGRVVADLDVAGDREVLAERMADEAVVGEDA